jgi:hypothetical protein
MAQENASPPGATGGRFSPDELRAAVRTLLALAAEHEWREHTFQTPVGFDWHADMRGAEVIGGRYPVVIVPDEASFPGLDDGAGVHAVARVERGRLVLARVVEVLLQEHDEREDDVGLDTAARLEAEHGASLVEALKLVRKGESPLHAGLPPAWLGDVAQLSSERPDNIPGFPPTPPLEVPEETYAAGLLLPLKRELRRDLVLLFVVAANHFAVGGRAGPALDVKAQVAAVAAALDQRRSRFQKAVYDELVRALLRAALPPRGALGPTSATHLANEVVHDHDRPTTSSRAARKNRRRRATLYALAALGSSDLVAAVDVAEPMQSSPDPDV